MSSIGMSTIGLIVDWTQEVMTTSGDINPEDSVSWSDTESDNRLSTKDSVS